MTKLTVGGLMRSSSEYLPEYITTCYAISDVFQSISSILQRFESLFWRSIAHFLHFFCSVWFFFPHLNSVFEILSTILVMYKNKHKHQVEILGKPDCIIPNKNRFSLSKGSLLTCKCDNTGHFKEAWVQFQSVSWQQTDVWFFQPCLRWTFTGTFELTWRHVKSQHIHCLQTHIANNYSGDWNTFLILIPSEAALSRI